MNALMPTDFQLHLFHEGTLLHGHQLFGAHVIEYNSEVITRFCVWAPSAQSVRLVGDFNNWNGDGYSFQKNKGEGIWSIVIKEDLTGSRYKYEIITKSGEQILKADPYGFHSELRPKSASIVYPLNQYKWNDRKWQHRKKKMEYPITEPIVIYEVHLGSWKQLKDGSFLDYRNLASELIPHVKEHGFTHIELLPLTEHPLDASWGYQGTGYYSVTSRYGSPYDFMYFVDQCHHQGIGVILDWVPGHFCKDSHGLFRFDGEHLYEYEDENSRENFTWGTANFDLGKKEVQSFLISNAIFWIEQYHIDGFRVDAVSNIIYRANQESDQVNEYGIEFLKKFNESVKRYDPTVLTFAEDSTDWPNVTKNIDSEGLGFSYKWNMGWMNDTLKYMETSPNYRFTQHNKVSFSLLYAFSEHFVLPFSHDEVVHGKKSLLDKMPGDYWQKFAQLRLLLGYMFAHPGKKLLFMGIELGQFSEWTENGQLDWNLLDYDMHRKLNAYIKELINIYKRSKALYELDETSEGFEWIDVHNNRQSIFSFIRKGRKQDDSLVVLCNFTPQVYFNYRIGIPEGGRYREIFNSDSEVFGGAGFTNKKIIQGDKTPYHGKPNSISLTIPPFGFLVLRKVKSRREKGSNGKEEMRCDASSRGEGK